MFGKWRAAALGCLLTTATLATPAQAEQAPHINLVSFVDSPYVLPYAAQPQGLVVEFVEALLQRAGIDYAIRILPPKRALLHALQEPDTCVFPIERSQEREVQFQWVSPILISRHGFFARPEQAMAPLRVLEDVRPYRVGSYLGSGIGDYLSTLAFDVDYAATNEANLTKLMAGRIDVWASDEVSASYIAKQKNMALPPSPFLFFTTVRAIACHTSLPEPLIDRLNQTLAEMHKTGVFRDLRKRFLERLDLTVSTRR